jgi:large subunit ribosomal protein L29
MLKLQQLRELTRDELILKRTDLTDERFNLRMRRSLKSLDNPLRLRTIRREIAKIDTILREDALGVRKLAEESASVLLRSKPKEKAQANKKDEKE